MFLTFSFLAVGILFIAFLLGIKHSIDADHVAATSSIYLKSPKFTHTLKLSILWSLGHAITAGIITIIFYLVKDIFLSEYLRFFEVFVAIMLIFIGTMTILFEFEIIKKRVQSKTDLNKSNETADINQILTSDTNMVGASNESSTFSSHENSIIDNKAPMVTLIGVIQGLASNEELLILLTFTLGLDDLTIIILGLIIFSLGVMLGMILIGSILKMPKIKKNHKTLLKSINIIIAFFAITYGFYILLSGESINFFQIFE